MSVLIYAARHKCDLCPYTEDVKPEPGETYPPGTPGGWLHFPSMQVGGMHRTIDLCPRCACRPINEVKINLERQ